MKKKNLFRQALVIALVVVFCFQVAACGYFLHPERRGQKEGEIDWRIVAFDAIGLVFFLIPGLIAFAVDFSSNTIYLPAKKTSSGEFDPGHVVAVKIPDDQMNQRGVEKVLEEHFGRKVSLDSPELKAYAMSDLNHLPRAGDRAR